MEQGCVRENELRIDGYYIVASLREIVAITVRTDVVDIPRLDVARGGSTNAVYFECTTTLFITLTDAAHWNQSLYGLKD